MRAGRSLWSAFREGMAKYLDNGGPRSNAHSLFSELPIASGIRTSRLRTDYSAPILDSCRFAPNPRFFSLQDKVRGGWIFGFIDYFKST